jgi:hypothetical protein
MEILKFPPRTTEIENPGQQKELDEEEARLRFEKIFGNLSGLERTGIVKGAKYKDYIDAMRELDFLDSDLEKLDLINYTASSAMESSAADDGDSGYAIHRFYIDRSARILGVFLHDVLSKINDQNRMLPETGIYFVNSNSILNVDPSECEEEKENREKRIARTLLHGKRGKKIINVIVDEFIARGDGLDRVSRYFYGICDKYASDESSEVMNIGEGFYTRSRHAGDRSVYRTNMEEPSWFHDKRTSGVAELRVGDSEVIAPVKDEDDLMNAKRVRESLDRAAVFVANVAKDGLKSSSISESEPFYSIIALVEEGELRKKSIMFIHSIYDRDADNIAKSLAEIEKHAKRTRNDGLLGDIPKVSALVEKILAIEDEKYLTNNEYIVLCKSVKRILEHYV